MVSMLFVITPGADWAYAIAAGLRHGQVTPAVTGLLAGHVAATLAVVAGVAALMAGTPLLLTVVTVAGAAYLVWLGVGAFRHPSTPYAETGQPVEASLSRQVLKGFAVSGLNPKVFVLFLALLPQFTARTAALPVSAQVLVLGAVHVVNCAVVYLAVGAGARVVLSARPVAARLVSRFSGAAMVGIGSILLIEQVVH
jgi:threonine/homoserine/homoserine lactone efflux protein